MRIEQISQKRDLRPPATARRCAPESSSAPAPVSDDFRYSAHDLDANGKLHLIVFSEDHCDLKRVRRMLEHSRSGAGVDRELPLVNGFSAHIDPKELGSLIRSLPENVGVHVNRMISFPQPSDLMKDASTRPPTGPPAPPSGGLDPSREVIGIKQVWDQGFTGKGIGVAVIDSGMYPHPDIKDHIKGWVDIAEGRPAPYDNFGHGTHVAGDVAGGGTRSAGRYKGIAPDADLIGVRITTVAEAIKGLQWCIDNKDKYNIRVVNMSLGDFASKSYKDDPWAQATEKAIEAGLIVVVAAGNEGPDGGTVSTPGIDPRVITVGAIDDKHTVDRKDDTMAGFSSRGPTSTDGITKPDIVAPGVSIYSTLAPGATLDVPELPHIGKDYIAISGTSMATPLVSGLVADLLQANPRLTHDDVKKILEASADRYLPDGSNAQGYGMVNAPRALAYALAMKDGASPPEPPPLPIDRPTAHAAKSAEKPAERAPTINELKNFRNVQPQPPRHLEMDGFLLSAGRRR
jgi:serine protease AprX